MIISENFPRYTAYNPLVPVWCLTPQSKGSFHRFFDNSPVSPSGRYVAVLQMPQEERLPQPGEQAVIALIDLHTGTESPIATTYAGSHSLAPI